MKIERVHIHIHFETGFADVKRVKNEVNTRIKWKRKLSRVET